MPSNINETQKSEPQPGSNANWQGVDKDPREEKGKAEQVTIEDLKGKKVDADPALPSDKPLSQKK